MTAAGWRQPESHEPTRSRAVRARARGARASQMARQARHERTPHARGHVLQRTATGCGEATRADDQSHIRTHVPRSLNESHRISRLGDPRELVSYGCTRLARQSRPNARRASAHQVFRCLRF